MILLDTNVVSEPLRKAPSQLVVTWLDAQPLESLFISVVAVAELKFGIARLPAGRRRDELITKIEAEVLPLFTGRTLAFDLPAANCYAQLMAKAQALGESVALADGLIGAVAAANNIMVATRDTSPFMAMGLAVINPWQVQDSSR